MIDAAKQRAALAYAEVHAIARELSQMNGRLIAKGFEPFVVGEIEPPSASDALAPSALDVVQLYEGQAHWYASEAQRLRAMLATATTTLEIANAPPAPLARGPRPVPLALVFAELTRTPWLFLRWLLFPPVTMLAAVVIGLPTYRSPTAGAAVLLLLLSALWIYGLGAGLARVRLLRIGEVATVLQRVQKMGATRNRNVPMLVARGWTISVESYTGMTHQTEFVAQTPGGKVSRARVSHGPAFEGVILVDPESGDARGNIDMGSTPQPDERGHWRATLSTRTWLTSVMAVTVSIALLVIALVIALNPEAVS